jgi:hypothetical protein
MSHDNKKKSASASSSAADTASGGGGGPPDATVSAWASGVIPVLAYGGSYPAAKPGSWWSERVRRGPAAAAPVSQVDLMSYATGGGPAAVAGAAAAAGSSPSPGPQPSGGVRYLVGFTKELEPLPPPPPPTPADTSAEASAAASSSTPQRQRKRKKAPSSSSAPPPPRRKLRVEAALQAACRQAGFVARTSLQRGGDTLALSCSRPRCPFFFRLHWDPAEELWYFYETNLGCAWHAGHPRREDGMAPAAAPAAAAPACAAAAGTPFGTAAAWGAGTLSPAAPSYASPYYPYALATPPPPRQAAMVPGAQYLPVYASPLAAAAHFYSPLWSVPPTVAAAPIPGGYRAGTRKFMALIRACSVLKQRSAHFYFLLRLVDRGPRQGRRNRSGSRRQRPGRAATSRSSPPRSERKRRARESRPARRRRGTPPPCLPPRQQRPSPRLLFRRLLLGHRPPRGDPPPSARDRRAPRPVRELARRVAPAAALLPRLAPQRRQRLRRLPPSSGREARRATGRPQSHGAGGSGGGPPRG